MAKFDSLVFVGTFDKVLESLQNSEKITKAVLQELSRNLLELLHSKNTKQGDIGYINRTINVLTPVNKRAFILFCKEFTGFICNDDGTMFLKKSKKHYDAVALKALEWLEDPLNNLWTWQTRNIDMEKVVVPYSLDNIRESFAQMVKKGGKVNISKADIIGAMFDTGFTIEDLIETLEKVEKLGEVMDIIEHDYVESTTPMIGE
jgi:hypothetical protein